MSVTTYMAECYWPDLREGSVGEAAERIRKSAAELTRTGAEVALAGTILVPGDEVVFYLFDGDSADVVREVCERARVPFERVVESETTLTEPA
jgi:hypothetical protein